jgi:predicted transcriptional regulator
MCSQSCGYYRVNKEEDGVCKAVKQQQKVFIEIVSPQSLQLVNVHLDQAVESIITTVRLS